MIRPSPYSFNVVNSHYSNSFLVFIYLAAVGLSGPHSGSLLYHAGSSLAVRGLVVVAHGLRTCGVKA